MLTAPAWMERAACRDADPAIFFPTATTWGGRKEAVRFAAMVCAECPVVDYCRAYSAREKWGIWAGIDRENEVPPC